MEITIGQHIRRVWEDSGLSKTAFAEKIGISRNNVYYLFERTNIDTELLRNICNVLNHDFFQYYTTTKKPEIKEAPQAIDLDDYKPKKKSKISLLIELDPSDEILLNKDFANRLKELMAFIEQ